MRRVRLLASRALARASRMIAPPPATTPPAPAPAPPAPPPPEVPVLDDPEILLPGLFDDSHITLRHCRWRFGHPFGDQALIFLCQLGAKGYTPIVEFGTFDGRTTLNLALNAPGAEIVTIDAGIKDDLSNVEKRGYGDFVPGECFRDAEPAVRDRITFLRSDSRRVDLSHLYGRMGLVLVDGGHSAEVCRSDSRMALDLIRPGGVIVWDDYTPWWPGVKEVVDEIAAAIPLYHLPRLGFVVHVAGAAHSGSGRVFPARMNGT